MKTMMKTPEEAEAEKRKLLPTPSLIGPESKVVPVTSQAKPSGVAPAKEVPQQFDQGMGGMPNNVVVLKTPQVKSGSVTGSKEVPQQTDQGKDGI